MNLIQGVEEITIFRKTEGSNDSFGNPTYEEESFTVENCLIEPAASSITETLFRDFSKIQVVVYAPENTIFEASDLVEINGKKYKLKEEAKNWTPFLCSIITPKTVVGLVSYNG